MRREQIAGGVCILIGGLALPGAAGATTPRAVHEGYAAVGAAEKPAVVGAPVAVRGGSLPFTGIDLGLIAAGGGLLLLGRGLRRLGRRE